MGICLYQMDFSRLKEQLSELGACDKASQATQQ